MGFSGTSEKLRKEDRLAVKLGVLIKDDRNAEKIIAFMRSNKKINYQYRSELGNLLYDEMINHARPVIMCLLIQKGCSMYRPEFLLLSDVRRCLGPVGEQRRYFNAMTIALALNNIQLARFLFRQGFVLNADNSPRLNIYPLHNAIEFECSIDIIELLLANRAHNLSSFQDKPGKEIDVIPIEELVSIHYRDPRILELLLAYKIDIRRYKNKETGNTPLHEAIANENFTLAYYMVNCHLFIDDVNDKFITPLMTALIYNKHDIIPRLLFHGANPNRVCFDGWTPLLFAIVNNLQKPVELMLNVGGDLRVTRKGVNGVGYARGALKDQLLTKLKSDIVDNMYLESYIDEKLSPDEIYLGDGLCQMCLDNDSCMVAVPCGHTSYCKECCYQYDSCTLCKKEIRKFIEIKK